MWRCLRHPIRLAISIEHRLVNRQDTTTAYTSLAWRRAVKKRKCLWEYRIYLVCMPTTDRVVYRTVAVCIMSDIGQVLHISAGHSPGRLSEVRYRGETVPWRIRHQDYQPYCQILIDFKNFPTSDLANAQRVRVINHDAFEVWWDL